MIRPPGPKPTCLTKHPTPQITGTTKEDHLPNFDQLQVTPVIAGTAQLPIATSLFCLGSSEGGSFLPLFSRVHCYIKLSFVDYSSSITIYNISSFAHRSIAIFISPFLAQPTFKAFASLTSECDKLWMV
ncbi:hypothetical protein PG989_007752 [Apiospora arundinis]